MVSTSLKNISQLGLLFPIYRKIKKIQTTKQIYIPSPPQRWFPTSFALRRFASFCSPQSSASVMERITSTASADSSVSRIDCNLWQRRYRNGEGQGWLGMAKMDMIYIYNINKETWWESIEFYVYEDGYMVGWSNVNKKIDVEKYMYIYV